MRPPDHGPKTETPSAAQCWLGDEQSGQRQPHHQGSVAEGRSGPAPGSAASCGGGVAGTLHVVSPRRVRWGWGTSPCRSDKLRGSWASSELSTGEFSGPRPAAELALRRRAPPLPTGSLWHPARMRPHESRAGRRPAGGAGARGLCRRVPHRAAARARARHHLPSPRPRPRNALQVLPPSSGAPVPS